MKVWILGLVLVLGLARADASGPPSISYAGGDGSSEEKAILIMGAPNDFAATQAEYEYLRQHFPKYEMVEQAFLTKNKMSYDRLDFRDASGKSRKIFFDITGTFGKF